MHYRSRHIETKLHRYKEHFKAVLVTGARQVGKSTLLGRQLPGIKTIVFDPVQDMYGSREDPDMFLNNFPPPPIIFDEVQYSPEILPALKRRVDLSEDSGQYFLTGSQNLSMLRSVAESMAGRVGILHLEGLTPEETVGRGSRAAWLEHYLNEPERLSHRYPGPHAPANLAALLWRGSMPGLLDKPDSIAADYYRSYIQTYIERDVRLSENIRDLTQFSQFSGLAAALTAQEVNASQFGRDVGVSPATARKWLDVLSNTYQWLELGPYTGNAVKRLSGKRKGYIRDTGLACSLQRISSPEALSVSPLLGPLFETWAVNAVYRYGLSLSVPPQMYHWRTNGGAEVDMVLERDGRLYPIEVKCKTRLNKHDIRGLHAFRSTYPHSSIAPGLVIYAGAECYRIDANTTAVPWNIGLQA